MKTNFLLLPIALGLFACHSNPTSGDGSQSVTLVGQWLWTRTSGGISGKEVITPTAGTRVVLTFSLNGQYSRHRNDTLQLSSQYVVNKARTIYSVDSLDMIVFQDSTEHKQVIMELTRDTLGLADNMYDGYGSTFIRIAN